MKREEIIGVLFGGVDPFIGVRPDTIDVNVGLGDGGSVHPYFQQVFEAHRPVTCLEVGSWLGGSAITIGNLLVKNVPEGFLICVDTWLGSCEHYLNGESKNVLGFRNGYPTLHSKFMSNLAANDLQSYILPLPVPSSIAAQILNKLSIKLDFVYLDGDHTFAAVRSDLELYYDILAHRGILLGDDWDWPEVSAAVKDFCYCRKLEFSAMRNKYMIAKKD